VSLKLDELLPFGTGCDSLVWIICSLPNEYSISTQEHLARVFSVSQQEREAPSIVDEASSGEVADELARV
jgi:hypothetical protein